MVSLKLDGSVFDCAAGAQAGAELFGHRINIGRLWVEPSYDGDKLAAALLAADAGGLVFGQLDGARGIAGALARGQRLLAAFAGDGSLEGCAIEESGHRLLG